MAGFAREHLRPLVGSAGLHLLLIALVVGMALRWTKPQEPVQLAIEGVVVDERDLPKSVRSGKALPTPRPEPSPEPAKQVQPQPPVEDTQARERAEADAAERAQVERLQAEQQKAREEAAAVERLRQDQAEAEKKQAADEARRKAEAEAQRKKAAEAEAEAQRLKDAQAKAAQDAKARAAREMDLKRRLAVEEDEGLAVAQSGVKDEYRALLTQAIERNWIRPPSARAGLACTLYVNQAAGGTVVDVKLGSCNGDAAVRESIVNAVYRASPLPPPSDPRAFERRLEIVFKPTE
jgi:colicin import membrane protein